MIRFIMLKAYWMSCCPASCQSIFVFWKYFVFENSVKSFRFFLDLGCFLWSWFKIKDFNSFWWETRTFNFAYFGQRFLKKYGAISMSIVRLVLLFLFLNFLGAQSSFSLELVLLVNKGYLCRSGRNFEVSRLLRISLLLNLVFWISSSTSESKDSSTSS